MALLRHKSFITPKAFMKRCRKDGAPSTADGGGGLGGPAGR